MLQCVMFVMLEIKIAMIVIVVVIVIVAVIVIVLAVALVRDALALVLIRGCNMKEPLVLVTTLKCNRKCHFCWHKRFQSKYGNSCADMSVETAKKLLEKHPNSAITLSGGEPMLNIPIIEYIASTGRPMSIQTNGDFKIPEDLKLPKGSQVRISINTLDFPEIFFQTVWDENISTRATIFFEDPDKTFEIIHKLSQYPVYSVDVNIDFHAEYTQDMTEKIKRYAKKAATLPLCGRNFTVGVQRQYDAYHRSLLSDKEPWIYGPDGERIVSIYSAGIPSIEWPKFLDGWIVHDYEIFGIGKSIFREGHPEDFSSPCAYYTCFMFEQIKKEREKQIDAFNSLFSNR